MSGSVPDSPESDVFTRYRIVRVSPEDYAVWDTVRGKAAGRVVGNHPAAYTQWQALTSWPSHLLEPTLGTCRLCYHFIDLDADLFLGLPRRDGHDEDLTCSLCLQEMRRQRQEVMAS